MRPLRVAGGLTVAAVLVLGTTLTWARTQTASSATPTDAAGPPLLRDSEPTATASPSPATTPAPSATPSPTVAASQPTSSGVVGRPWGKVTGLLQFRGNPTHTWYGQGPVPRSPEIAWRYPDRPMCVVETSRSGEHKRWCGTGWTGQPLVWERPDGVTEMIVGAYDGAIHFLDTATGTATRPRFQTGLMIKGTLTLDPDGYPLLYGGSRDGRFRVIALDREVPTELWGMDAHPRRVWNDDWDGNASVEDDVLYVGGEDSWFRAVLLRRGYGHDGRVTVDPEVLVEVPGWTEQLLRDIGDRNVSIESSVALFDDRAYFVNSGGRVVGLDVSNVRSGDAPIVFDYWVGDDADASIVIDGDGMLYVAVEYERKTARAREVGQLVKLDPSADGDPRVWGLDLPPRADIHGDDGGAWSTPALHDGTLYLTTHAGDLLAVDAASGAVRYRERIGYHEWSSPSVVTDDDGVPILIVALCEQGGLRAYDVSDPAAMVERWTLRLPSGACIESTPAVWRGGVYVGSRDGYLYGIRDL